MQDMHARGLGRLRFREAWHSELELRIMVRVTEEERG
ncbi:MAG: hypothetical protein JWR35_3902 [Marmoricola sp.]|nr:hypothetical protein [Marmoricola sp.]